MISSCPKSYSLDQDKMFSPSQTVAQVTNRLKELDISILKEIKRIDTGRLGIPVFLSACAADARAVMPTRKQMGKGASIEQAEASALMELMERYGFFSFWQRKPGMITAFWDEAEALFGDSLISLSEMVKTGQDAMDEVTARKIMNLRKWQFFPATRVLDGKTVYLPLDMFKQLSEFNGSSAGNADAESILQGACELAERHVCCLIDRNRPTLPSISLDNTNLPNGVLRNLVQRFRACGISLVLKDFSLGLPVPTVGAIAWDPTTFPTSSEIVFTAGTATSPEKAAIRAITEVAQLAGDFCTNACYEASGLPKFATLDEAAWLLEGPMVSLASLPDVSAPDIKDELLCYAEKIQDMGFTLYSVSTTNPDTQVPSHYNIIPGFTFRECAKNASLGLFTGRIIAENEQFQQGVELLQKLEHIVPQAGYIPFFKGLLHMRANKLETARAFFAESAPLQEDVDSHALALFYLGYCHTLEQQWEEALPYLDMAATLCPEMKEFLNLRGVALFKKKEYAKAAQDFSTILSTLDKGSVMDIMNLGLCYKFMGNKDKAIHYLSSALEIDPSLTGAKMHLTELIGVIH